MSCIMNDELNLLSRTSLLQFCVVCVGSKVVLKSCGHSVSCSCRLTVDHRGVPEGLGRQHTSQPLSHGVLRSPFLGLLVVSRHPHQTLQ
jgi:hypothetical protein